MPGQTDATPRQRVLATLYGERTGDIPVTAYECFVPSCTFERQVRNRGLCIVYRFNSYRTFFRTVKTRTLQYTDEAGRFLVRTEFETPHGTLWTLAEPRGSTSWLREHLFKTPDDYRALLYLVRDTDAVPEYAAAASVLENLGEDYLVRDNLPLEPLQSLISSIYMDATQFSYEWIDNRDELLLLYEAFADLNRRIYPMVAEGPLQVVNYGGNVVPQIIGRELFESHYLPHYAEAAEILHRKGKRLGSHFDADNTPIMDLIGRSALDYVEAYDPGMSPGLGYAREMFGDRTIWINWPSAWHHHDKEHAASLTRTLVEDEGRSGRLIIGVTEDMPSDRWKELLSGIMDGVDEADRRSESNP